jgi:hypothetical protein
MVDVFQLVSPRLGQTAHSFAGVDAGDGALPHPLEYPLRNFSLPLKLVRPSSRMGTRVARNTRDIG